MTLDKAAGIVYDGGAYQAAVGIARRETNGL